MSESAWELPEARSRWLVHMRWSVSSAVLGVALGVMGIFSAATYGYGLWSLVLLGTGGLFLFMSGLTGIDLLWARAAMQASSWQPCEFTMSTKSPGHRWPWVLRFTVPVDIQPALIKEGWRLRARQAAGLSSGEGCLVVKDRQPIVVAPSGFTFLLTVRPPKSQAEEEKCRESFRYPIRPSS